MGKDNRNETRFVTNLTSRVLTFGDLHSVELLPGKTVDLLKRNTL